MAKLHVYTYSACSTCRKALRWLRDSGVPFEEHPIRETPPSPDALRLGIKTCGGLRRVLNTSSRDYRDLGLKDRLDSMAEAEVFALIRGNGNLVKRPFLVGESFALAGFKPDEWSRRIR